METWCSHSSQIASMSPKVPSPMLASSQMLPRLLIAAPRMNFGTRDTNALCPGVTCFVGHRRFVRCKRSIHTLLAPAICWQFAPRVSTECKIDVFLVQLAFIAWEVAKARLATSNAAPSVAQRKPAAVALNRTVCANPASVTTDRRACLVRKVGTNRICPTTCHVAQNARAGHRAWQAPRQ